MAAGGSDLLVEEAATAFELPWSRRLRFREGVRHCTSIEELQQISVDDSVASFHLAFLLFASSNIKQKPLPQWRIVYALGPFSGMREPRRLIPFVAVANFNRPYRHISHLSKLLADPFSEFGILPDIYMLPTRSFEYLDGLKIPAWERTLVTAVPLFRKGERAEPFNL